ncbi:hypothetical protein [Nocardiopsis listeri]|uniref:hypothetical protein n=1 Tax=Nocardiopsis listeri TaxID=53440 RepID=UPI00168114F3|nr:hypothetical protein [Nocardiopsis listeri]
MASLISWTESVKAAASSGVTLVEALKAGLGFTAFGFIGAGDGIAENKDHVLDA